MKIVLLLTFGSLLLLYLPLNRQTPRYRLNLHIDNLIPLIPWTVLVYLSYYLLIPASLLLIWKSVYIIPYLVTQIMGTAIASLVWRLFPNGVKRPQLSGASLPLKILGLIYHHDADCNGLPSGHVMHTFIACFFLSLVYSHLWFFFFLVLLAISLSTLTTKQHYFIDMICTLLLTPLVIKIVSMLNPASVTKYLAYIIHL